jgi:hypothetical protein
VPSSFPDAVEESTHTGANGSVAYS